ncbi:MAG: hypothetical protein WA364_25830 [Candidatus Nitrosopolaris sp.]
MFYDIYGPNGWQPAPSIVTGGFTSTIPALAFAGDSILIAFEGGEGDQQIYYSVNGIQSNPVAGA